LGVHAVKRVANKMAMLKVVPNALTGRGLETTGLRAGSGTGLEIGSCFEISMILFHNITL
jgi:hypothetical protein